MEAELMQTNKNKRSFERFRDLVEGLNSKYFLFANDPDGKISYLSPSFKKLLGYEPEEQLGKMFYDLADMNHPLNQDIQEGELFHVRSGSDFKCIRALRCQNQGVRLFELQTYGVIDETGELVENKGIARDVTDEYKSQHELQDRIAELTRKHDDTQLTLSQAMRISAISNMAIEICHDICNPLYAIQNYASAISQYVARPDGSLAAINLLARDIFKATQQASKIVKHLRPSPARINQERAVLPLTELLVEALNVLEPEIKLHNIHKNINVNDLSITTRVDRAQIRQVLVNLVAHMIDALKNIPQEQRKIKIEILAINEELEIVISGNGTKPASIEYEKEAQEQNRKHLTPTELSISFCRAVIEANGGRLGYLPSQREEMSFHILLPRHRAS